MVLDLMKSPWLTLAAVLIVGLAIGAAIAGRPATPAPDIRISSAPTTSGATTTSPPIITAAPPFATTTVPAPVTTEATTTIAVIESTATTEPGTTTTTTTIPPSPDRSTVHVLVANADSASGIATAEAARLVTIGYHNPLTADASGPQKETVVYARAGHEDEGLLLLADAGLPADRLRPFPNQAFTTRDDQANVILALGNDWKALEGL